MRAASAGEVIVRINALDLAWWLDDLDMVAKAKPDAVLVPKVSTPGHLEDVAERLIDISADHRVRAWAMMETPLAMLNAREIAAAAADVEMRLAAFVMGTNDLAKETRQGSPRAFRHAAVADGLHRGGARAFGLDILDGVFNDPSRCAGLRARMRRSARHGLRRQDPHPSAPDRALQRGAFRRARMSRPAKKIIALRSAGEQGQGRRPTRRAYGGTPACRHGAAHGSDPRGDRGAPGRAACRINSMDCRPAKRARPQAGEPSGDPETRHS